MKVLLSSVIALVVLFSVSTAFVNHSYNSNKSSAVKFDNPQWNKGPCSTSGKTSVTITGMVTGGGSTQMFAHITGYYDCVNKGTQTPDADKWSNIDVVVPLQTKPSGTGGNLKVTAVLESLCEHANWTFLTKELKITIQNSTGGVIIGATDVTTC